MKRKTNFFGILLLGLGLCQSVLAAEVKTADTQAAVAERWREKLTPGVEALLNQQCGEDCPSFRLEPKFGADGRGAIDDVGFSKPVEGESTPTLKSVALTIVHTSAIAEASRESLRQVLAARVANEAGVPVTVSLQLLSGPMPLQSRLAAAGTSQTLAYLKTVAWPLSIVLVGMIAFFSLALALRAKRRLALELHRAGEEALANARKGAESSRGAEVETLRQEALRLLDGRAADLEFWLEDRALQRDFQALASCIQLFSPVELSRRLKLSSGAIRALASLEPAKAAVGSKELVELETSLDFAHWKRLAAERDPVSTLASFPDAELGRISKRLSNGLERAFLLSKVPEKRWPAVLGRWSSEERVQAGLDLSSLSAQPEDSLRKVEDSILATIRAVRGGLAGGALDRLSPYLNETEFREISRLSNHAGGAHLSAEAILESMEDPELAELCLRLELADLRILMRSVTAPERQRIEKLLPGSLRERLKGTPAARGAPAEAEQLRARAAFVVAYRQAFGSEMVQ